MSVNFRRRLQRLFQSWCGCLSTSEIMGNEPLLGSIEEMERYLFEREERCTN